MYDKLKAELIRSGFTHSDAALIIELARHGWDEAQAAVIRVVESAPDRDGIHLAIMLLLNGIALESMSHTFEEMGVELRKQ